MTKLDLLRIEAREFAAAMREIDQLSEREVREQLDHAWREWWAAEFEAARTATTGG